MNPDFTIQCLSNNIATFKKLLAAAEREEYTWRQSAEKWCLLEIVCHLLDEEKEDFGARVKSILADPEKPLPAIDPVGWVSKRKYIEKDYKMVLDRFITERENSIIWLKGLQDAKWENTYHHPKLGSKTAFYFLTNWLAHDYLHFRQITKLKYDYLQHISGQELSYAGGW